MERYEDSRKVPIFFNSDGYKQRATVDAVVGLIWAINTNELKVDWSSLRIAVDDPGDGPLTPFNSYKPYEDMDPVPMITVAVKCDVDPCETHWKAEKIERLTRRG